MTKLKSYKNIYFIFPFVAIVVCFNTSSISMREGQEILLIILNFTLPSSDDITLTIITTDGTATGKFMVITTWC